MGDYGIHTCNDECPCHTGGKPSPDFLPVEGPATLMMLALGISAAEVAELAADARRRSRGASDEIQDGGTDG